MAVQLFANNAYSTLASQLTSGATSLSLTTGEGARFPSPTGGDWFLATITNATETAWEIVKCTARTTDTLTVVRGQEGTSDVTWDAGSVVELRLTAGSMHNPVSLNATTLTDVLSLSTQELSAVDFGADGFWVWDDSESKATYFSVATVQTVLGLGTAAYTASTAYEPAGVSSTDITDSTVDGRALLTSLDANPFTDADESKLDGIEANATADQNAAEVSVAASPVNYTAGTATVEGHLSGIDTAFGSLNHDTLSGFVANEHIDWTSDQGATNIHSGNIPDLSATYASKGVYRHVYIPAAAMVAAPTNGAAAGSNTFSTQNLELEHYAFDATTSESVIGVWAIPDEIDTTAGIKIKFFWDQASSASGTVTWQFASRRSSDQQGIDSSLLNAVTATDTALGTAGFVHQIVTSSAHALGGSGSFMVFKVSRDISDTLSVDAQLYGIQIQYKESSTDASAW